MKRIQLLSLSAATLLGAGSLQAQTPAPAAAPGATPAPAAAATPAAPAADAPKLKPYSAADAQKLGQLLEALQFHIKMAEKARHAGKDKDKELVAVGTRAQKEATDYYTPLVNMAQAHQMQNIPTEMSKSDKGDMEKLNKVKEEKWKEEYFELFARAAKKNARLATTASTSLTDVELKDLSMKLAKIFDGQAELFERNYKEIKNPKKDGKDGKNGKK
jgi:hypothetical protein